MRQALKAIEGIRGVFQASFDRWGSKLGFKGWPIKTFCLVDVRDGRGQLMTAHLWFTWTKTWPKEMEKGQLLQFTAKVKPYTKGYRGHRDHDLHEVSIPRTDYKLAWPGDVRLIELRGHNAERTAQLLLL